MGKRLWILHCSNMVCSGGLRSHILKRLCCFNVTCLSLNLILSEVEERASSHNLLLILINWLFYSSLSWAFVENLLTRRGGNSHARNGAFAPLHISCPTAFRCWPPWSLLNCLAQITDLNDKDYHRLQHCYQAYMVIHRNLIYKSCFPPH